MVSKHKTEMMFTPPVHMSYVKFYSNI